ncbi:hypothetical protein GCM10022383_00540 [Microbacterium soli]|uniref:Uncharacterized protein n=1 Tax=Microbacterium soli TaxID=446075 RepID=A0ABP7MKL3_9MICO
MFLHRGFRREPGVDEHDLGVVLQHPDEKRDLYLLAGGVEMHKAVAVDPFVPEQARMDRRW